MMLTFAESPASPSTLAAPAEAREEHVQLRQEQRGSGERNERSDRNSATPHVRHLLSLEVEVLERFGSAPVEICGSAVLAALRLEIALGDPGRRPMACG